MDHSLLHLLSVSLDLRLSLSNWSRDTAFRLFNGYAEGFPSLLIDIFGQTLVILEGKRDPKISFSLLEKIISFYAERIPSIRCAILKKRHSSDPDAHKGEIVYGSNPSTAIKENDVHYAVNLIFQQDESFYIDNRNVRIWLKANAKNWNVLNTFAYTGSLGIAALAGGASSSFQTDRNPSFLNLAKQSAQLNKFDESKQHYEAFDFFKVTSKLRSSQQEFDAVILDPPFFAKSSHGTVDLQFSMLNLVNKVRPLVKHGGFLILINNSLYLSGKTFLSQLDPLFNSGFVQLQEIIPIPEDCAGYQNDIKSVYPADPYPFNHPTKIVILKVTRKHE